MRRRIVWCVIPVLFGCTLEDFDPYASPDAGRDADSTIEASAADADEDAEPGSDADLDGAPADASEPDAPSAGDADADADADAGDADAGDATDGDGGTCDWPLARALLAAGDTVSGTLEGTGMSSTTSCTEGTGTLGPETIYPLRLTETLGVELRVTSDADTVLAIRTQCAEPRSELACNDDLFADPNPEIRTALPPGDYFVVVDTGGFEVGDDYELTLSSFPLVTNASCLGATRIAPGTPIDDANVALGFPGFVPCDIYLNEGRTLYYEVDVPARSLLSVRASRDDRPPPLGVTEVPRITLRSGCETRDVCHTSESPTSEATYSNITDVSERVIIALSYYGRPPDPSLADLEVSLAGLAANATCDGATPLADGASEVDDFAEGTFGELPCGLGGETGRALWYRLSVPARSRAIVDASADVTPTISRIDACGAASCLGTEIGSATHTNITDAPVDVWVAITQAEDVVAATPVAVSADIGPLPEATCSGARATLAGERVASHVALGSSGSTPCLGALEGRHYYSTTVAANTGLLVRQTGALLRLQVIGDCEGDCLAFETNSGFPLVYRNGSGSPEPVIVVAGSNTSSTFFTLDFEPFDPPSNTTCDAARAVTAAYQLLPAQDTTVSSTSLAGLCVPGATEGALFYGVPVPAGRTLTVTAQGIGAFTPLIRLLASCAAPTCIMSAASPSFRDPVTFSHTNLSGTTEDLVFAISPAETTIGGLFDLTVRVD